MCQYIFALLYIIADELRLESMEIRELFTKLVDPLCLILVSVNRHTSSILFDN